MKVNASGSTACTARRYKWELIQRSIQKYGSSSGKEGWPSTSTRCGPVLDLATYKKKRDPSEGGSVTM
jgi:hypothetical protein